MTSSSSTKRSPSPWLPFELIEQILYRTPAESLIRSKSTCKQWRALITSKAFIYKHLNHSPERFIRTVKTVKIMDPVNGTRLELPYPNEVPRGHLSIDYLVHIDGLILCKIDYGKPTELAIWNPILRTIKWIYPSYCFREYDYYGIGYDNKKSRYDYKILRFPNLMLDIQSSDYVEPDAELYDFKTDTWKSLNTEVDGEEIRIGCKGVSVMGNMYWIIHYDKIVCFDFSVETFREICEFSHSYNGWGETLLTCFDGERLCLLQQGEETKEEMSVWLTEKLSGGDVVGNVSFSKYFSVVCPDLPLLECGFNHSVFSLDKGKRVRFWCEEEIEDGDTCCICVSLYEVDQSGIKKRIETERHYGYDRPYSYDDGSFLCGYVYTPSLVPIP